MINGVSMNTAAAATDVKSYSSEKKTEQAASESTAAAVYEKSSDYKSIASMSASERANLVAQMKSDAESQTAQLRSLVEKMMTKQADATVFSKSTWQKMLDEGLITDKAAIAKAKEDVSENGYWGAEQTSDRILSFAVALSGGDEEKMKEMQDAFEKGFKQATKAWGDTLPDLCQDTYSAVSDKFAKWFEEN